jgi:hypothetical protein
LHFYTKNGAFDIRLSNTVPNVSSGAFQNSDIVNLGDLEFVERSNKIRVEKLLNGLPIILGEYNAPTNTDFITSLYKLKIA